MQWSRNGLALVAGAALCLGGNAARAADPESYRDAGAKVFRLGGGGGIEAKTVTLQGNAAALEEDTYAVRCWRGGWGGWGGRCGWGGWGGGWGGWGGCGWGGWGGGWGCYRPYVSYWSAPVYSYSYYSPIYYSTPVYYSSFWPCRANASVIVNTSNFNLALQRYQGQALANDQALVNPRVVSPSNSYAVPGVAPRQQYAPADSTYQYNGGPSNPVPMPQQTQPEAVPAPNPNPNISVPLEGRTVSLPGARKQPSKYQYAAYGETPAMPRQAPVPTDTLLVKQPR